MSSATSFLITVFTKGQQVAAVLSKLSGPIVAAMLAIFHDVMLTVTAASATGAALQTGNIPSTFALSETTLALLVNLKSAIVAGDQLAVADLKILGILK